MSPKIAIGTRDLSFGYANRLVLTNMSFSFGAGEVVALIGPNCSGKTTLLKCLVGLLPARSGTIRFAGTDVTRLPPHARARLGLGYVPQGREIFPRLTVQENLEMGRATRPSGSRVPGRIFDMFPGPAL